MQTVSQILQQAEDKIKALIQLKAAKLSIRSELSHTLQQIVQRKTEYREQVSYMNGEIETLAEHNTTIEKDIKKLRGQLEESKQQMGLISSLALGEQLKLSNEIRVVTLRIQEQMQKSEAEEKEDNEFRQRLRAKRKELEERNSRLEEAEEHLKEKIYQQKQHESDRSNTVGLKFKELEQLFEL